MLAYLAANKVHARYPKVTEQVETVPLRLDKLHKCGYNPTIIEHGGALLMCYRYHEGTLASKLMGATLAESGDVSSQWPVDAVGHSLEDPKFFHAGLQLWMSWVEAYWPVKALSSVRYGFFRDNVVHESARPVYGENDGEHVEKSWVFFEHANNLHFIYKSHPKQIVVQWSGQAEQEYVTDGPRWPYGEVKGGTAPLPYEGKWLRFFHSTLDNDMGIAKRRYYVGALLMETTPPYQAVRVSRKPIIYGSEIDNLAKDERKACVHWKPNVVFPGGAIERGGGWLVSLGVNDSACVIAHIKPEQLHL